MKQTIIITECSEQQGWNKNTELCMDVKTFLRSDARMQDGKNYQGVLRRDVTCEEFKYNETLTFVETASRKTVKRNPHIFEGEYITVIRRDDGTYHPRTGVGTGGLGRGRVMSENVGLMRDSDSCDN